MSAQIYHNEGCSGGPQFVLDWNPYIFVSLEPLKNEGTIRQSPSGRIVTAGEEE
jgi:hypothetical protein